MKNNTLTAKSIRFFSFISALLLLLTACKGGDEGNFDSDAVGGAESTPNTAEDSPEEFVRLSNSAKAIQYNDGYIYFYCVDSGAAKYSLETGEVSEICTDPLCRHIGKDASCYIAKMNEHFFRPMGNIFLYTILRGSNAGLYSYDTISMSQICLDDDASTINQYCVSDKYLYTWNTVVKEENGEKISYHNYKRVDLTTGETTELGELTKGKPEYRLIGAYNGLLLATNPEETVTYVCSEEAPWELEQIWNRRMGFIFTNGKELLFKSENHESVEPDTYYFYHTDLDGNVISRHELKDGMYWGTLSEGRYLYYIPQKLMTVSLPLGKVTMHQRYLYRLDTVTGETTVAFEFSGDYSYLWLELGDCDIMVKDGKLYTSHLQGYIYPGGDTSAEPEKCIMKSGMVIIDMETGALDYITAEYDPSNDYMLECNIEHVEMELEY